MIALISVPHTGTHFTVKLFTDVGYEAVGFNEMIRHDKTLLYGHALKLSQRQRARALAAKMPLVIPLRHPYRVWESWRRRHRRPEEMVEVFRTLREFDRFDPIYFPIDSEDRDEHGKRLFDLIGIEGANWSRVVNGRQNTHDVALADCKVVPQIVELAEELEPLVSRFYG